MKSPATHEAGNLQSHLVVEKRSYLALPSRPEETTCHGVNPLGAPVGDVLLMVQPPKALKKAMIPQRATQLSRKTSLAPTSLCFFIAGCVTLEGAAPSLGEEHMHRSDR